MLINLDQLITNGDMSGDLAATQQILHATAFAIQAVWTGDSAAGTMELQSSNDGTNWNTITGSSQSISGAGSFLWNYGAALPAYNYVQFVFLHSGGSEGTLNVTCNYKGF